MATSAAFLPPRIDFKSTDEEIFIAFDKFTSGSPLPNNVIDYVNPYRFEPQNLPDDVWFLIDSKENTDMEHGFWKIIDGAREVFSNSEIIGWRTTLKYHKVHVPQEHGTDWVMQVFSTTQKRLCEDNERKETSSLCRVFLVPSHEMQQEVSSDDIDAETRNHVTQLPVLDAISSRRTGFSTEVNRHDETEVLSVAERFTIPEHQRENHIEVDFFARGQMEFFSGGDFLELKDLDNPASSSSSENSSISSEECFDSEAFLQDLEDPITEQNDASKKLNVTASNRSDEVLVVPAALELLVSVDGSHYSGSDEFFKTTSSAANSSSGSRNLNDKVKKHAKVEQKGEGPSTSSHSHRAASGRRKRAGFGGIGKLRKKYLCFMPF